VIVYILNCPNMSWDCWGVGIWDYSFFKFSCLLPWHRGGVYICCCSQHPLIPRRSWKWQAITFEVGISWCQYTCVVKYSRVWWYLIIKDGDLGHFVNINAGYERW